MIIRELEIKKFRNIENQNIKLGEVLTLIIGQNGVGKSSLLGLIAQPFGFYGGAKWQASNKNLKEKYDIPEYKDVYGNPFETIFSDIFRLSKTYDHPDFDKENREIRDSFLKNKYIFSLKFCEKFSSKYPAFTCQTKDRGKDDATIRFVLKDEKSSDLNYSTFIFPVKYLGLNRTFPLVDISGETIEKISFTDEEKKFFNEQKNYIALSDENFEESILKSGKISKTVISTKEYDYEGMSVGQDNISKIITTIISFKRLKENLKEKYQGGIILIDEIEATLFPSSQLNLLKFLYNECSTLNIQIIATTHSISLIENLYLNKDKFKKKELIFLKKRDGIVTVKNTTETEFEDIKYDLTFFKEKKKDKKIKVFLEDNEATIFFKNLLDRTTLSRIDIQKLSLDSNNYINLYQHKFDEIKKNIVVLDGDANDINKFKVLNKKIPKNFLFLPGDCRPEEVFYNFLSSLEEKHKFWEEGKYTKQQFLNNYREAVTLQKGKENKKERNLWKDWFNSEKNKWGKDCKKFFKYWKIENNEKVKEFQKNFLDVLDNLK